MQQQHHHQQQQQQLYQQSRYASGLSMQRMCSARVNKKLLICQHLISKGNLDLFLNTYVKYPLECECGESIL